ncbi:sensor histidine kinase [Gemmatirosa kalamazoonensis]|uniref:sensor histidine kinase n=1 Tax=Gemmatirosa kalamazoonensis TaxID=861299 RepID=UPI003CCCC4FA
MPHVFDRYWQAERGTHHGVGLGLTIVRGIVEAHGGSVDVESRPGAGTTFRFTLPACAPERRATA